MANSFSKTVVTSLLLAATGQAAVLAPANDVVFPSSKTSQNPLQYSGANTPYFAGPNVNGVENTVPDKCTVQQAAYVVRHGSR
jgi:phosphopantothenoylcysteine synthetase/decarboxylase